MSFPVPSLVLKSYAPKQFCGNGLKPRLSPWTAATEPGKCACCQTFLEIGWLRRCWRISTERWACTRVANGITTRVPFPLAHQISQRGVRFDAISCHETTPTSLSQFAHRCRICCNVPYSSLGPKRETRAKDLGSRTVATFFACTIPLCAEDFKSQHEEFMRSEHSLHPFLVWFLLIFHALRFANCGSQQFFSVITLIFDKFWNTLAPLQPTFALFSGSQSPVLCVVAFNSRIFTLRNLHTYEYTEKY